MTTTEQAGSQLGTAPAPTGPVSPIDYTQTIPNNVDLATDRRLQRALESWQSPARLDAGEITDKGYVNQALVRQPGR